MTFPRKEHQARQNGAMLTPTALRLLGPDELADLLRRRPDVLAPVPPRSLAELVARLTHPVNLRAALQGLSLPTLQVAEVLAALGETADRARLDALLGIAPGDPLSGSVERALDELRERFLIVGGYRLLPQVREQWAAPLGLDADVESFATSSTVDDLRAFLANLDVPRAAGRKAELVARLVGFLGDGDNVRQLVASAPPGLAEQLRAVAHGRRHLSSYAWYSPRSARYGGPSRNPLEWALARFLLVRQDWTPVLRMPAEVALALRGPGWTAPFTPDAPAVRWVTQDPDAVARSSVAASAQALRSLTAVLTTAGKQPVPLLKSGAVGVRELRRLATSAGCGTGPLRLTLALAHALGLVDVNDAGLVPTLASDAWQRRPAAERFADLVRAWLQLPTSPLEEPAAAWSPQRSRGVRPLRRVVLDLLAGHPQAAPGSPAEVAAAVRWQLPLLLGRAYREDGGEEDGAEPEELSEVPGTGEVPGAGEVAPVGVRAVLDEAAWLGLTGAGALAASGRAARAGDDVAEVLRDALGTAEVKARLQTDLTAVVLGEPSPDMAAALDLMADRESRSAAATWRFSPVTIRRAMDTGAGSAEILDTLRGLADGGIPQALEYLVHDVARRHGTLRGGQVSCYLRSEDEALVAELAVDRKLRRLGLRRVAPSVVVGGRPLPETLEVLRAAGYAPVEEGPDGEVVLTRAQWHRAADRSPSLPRADGVAGVAGATGVAGVAGAGGRRPVDEAASVAATLLEGQDEPAGTLVDLGSCVVDSRSMLALGDGAFDELGFIQDVLHL